MHRLNNMNAAEMNRLAMLHKDQVTWIAFIENVSYKTQLYVLENKDVEDLLNVIYNIGGIVRRDDLINIYFNGDKNKYALISKMAKFNLLKIEGSRKAIIGLTSASLSIIRKKVEKNSKKPSSSTSNELDIAAFLLHSIKSKRISLVNEFDFCLNVIDFNFDSDYCTEGLCKKRNDMQLKMENHFNRLIRNNIYIIHNNNGLAPSHALIYALNKVDLELKLDVLSSLGSSSMKMTRLILPLKILEGKENVESDFVAKIREHKVVNENTKIEFI